jgi:hypothetical protein
MMPLAMWAHLDLSPATLHSARSVTLYYRVTWHCSSVRRVVHNTAATL